MPIWRRAQAGDDDAVVALAHALYSEDPSPEPVPDTHTRRTLLALRDEPSRGQVVVLAEGERLLGYALLVSYWSNELGGATCEIDELFVAPEARGRGHASALLDALARGSELWGRPTVALCLQVTADNARARALYERHDFAASDNRLMIRRARGAAAG